MRLSCVEAIRPQREEGRARHPHPCSHHHQAQTAGRTRHGHAESAHAGRIPKCLCVRCQPDRRRRASTIREIGGDVGENRDRLFAFVEKQGIEFSFNESIAPALGMSYGGRIALLPGQSKAEEFSTLVHELAHELMHKAERRTATTKVMRESEAEAVAFIVGKAVGLDTGTASADYIRLYDGNAALLTESLEVIQHASAAILAALEPGPDEAEESQLAQAS